MTGEYDDDPIVRALRAPGTPAELSREAEALAAFRSVARGRGRLVRRLSSRLGAGGAAAVAVVAISGAAAAAAYANQLPGPMQQFAHHALGTIGVPEPRPEHHSEAVPTVPPPTQTPGAAASARRSATPTPAPGTHPSPTVGPSAGRSTPPATEPAVPTEASSPFPGSSASAGAALPTAPVTPSGTASAPPAGHDRSGPAIAAIAVEVGARRVPEGATVSVAGTATDTAGTPVAGRRVVLAVRRHGGHWQPVARGRTDDAGHLVLSTPGLLVTSRVRLQARGATTPVVSEVVEVAVVPSLSAKYADGRISVDAGADHAGETVLVGTKRTGLTIQAVLDESGVAQVAVVPAKHDVRFRVVLPASKEHAAAEAGVVVPGTQTPDPGDPGRRTTPSTGPAGP